MSMDVQFSETVDRDLSDGDYRAVSGAAVTSVALGFLSICVLLTIYLAVIPLVGILVGLYAILQIKGRPKELTGRSIAVVGIVLCLAFLITGGSVAAYVYATEVPSGYTRIFYSQLQPEEGKVDQNVPPLAESLDGEKVFIKGYVFPGKQRQGIKTFLLVRDKGDCCFGGNPKLTDRIQVTLADPERLTFDPYLHKVAGTFRLGKGTGEAVDASGDVYYYLDDGQLR
ncbi:MAG: hypothetical protein P8K78_10375 [Pirellulales bacterium]|nr:hypothetical protein [Pirellulales bacterium]